MIKKFEKYLIRESNGSNPCILFVNGFRHWMINVDLDVFGGDKDTSDVLCQFGDELVLTYINWKMSKLVFNSLKDKIENNNIVGIVGFSAGGYLSFNLSNKYKIPALSINPAMAPTSAAPALQPLPEDVKNADIFNKQMIIIGDKDTKETKGVDGQLVIKMLEKMNFDGDILMLRDTYHLISKQQFNGVFNRFYKKYIG
jgi:hypothetical protein